MVEMVMRLDAFFERTPFGRSAANRFVKNIVRTSFDHCRCILVGEYSTNKNITTMEMPYYHINAFERDRFAGNPARVCILEKWLPNNSFQKIAFKNNLSEPPFW